jgi:CDGSH-type Zn-finger protein
MENNNLPKLAQPNPVMVKVEPSKIYAWCTCGFSEKSPFFDGTHNKLSL